MHKKMFYLTFFALTLAMASNAGAALGDKGNILFEWFDGTTGGNLDQATDGRNAIYPLNPSQVDYLAVLQGPTSRGNNYMTRARGYIYPPETGDYTFWTSSDDHSRLWLSTDADPANKVLIAEVSGYTSALQWDKMPSQMSAPVPLQAGQQYYIEVLHRDGTGGDNLAAGWGGPGIGAGPVVIDGAFLSPWLRPIRLPNPADGSVDADIAAVEWTAADVAASYKVYLSTDETIDESDFVGETPLALQVVAVDPGVTYYWRVDTVEADGTVVQGPVWSFTTLPMEAHFPIPADGAINVLSTELSWTAGKNAILHNVYLGTDPAALPPVSMMQMATTYNPGALQDGKVYYWRVDEFSLAGTVAGPVWSFTTPPAIEVTDPNLVGAWTFEEGPGGTVVLDYSGHGNHGIIAGAANQQYVAGVEVLWMPALSNYAMEFLGDDQGHVELPGNMPITAAKGTIAMWINTTQGNAANNDEGMLFWAGPTGGDGYGDDNEIHLNIDDPGEGQLDFFIEDDPSGGDKTVDYDNIGGTGWRHVAATWDLTDGIRLYVDGMEVDNDSHNGATYGFQTIRLGRPIGTGGGNRCYEGLMDEVMLYDYALSADQIAPLGRDIKLAISPDPADGAIGLSPTPILSWTPGVAAVEHDLYLSTDAAEVADVNAAVYKGRLAAATFDPGALEFGTTYYWSIVEVAADGSIPLSPSKVWSFTTAPQVPASANLGAATSNVPGFLIHTLKAQAPDQMNFAGMNEIFDTGLWMGLPPDPNADGTRIDVFVNLRDTSSNGVFNEGNGYPDSSFPGIDPLEVPAQDPAAGDDDNDFATEVTGSIQLTAGQHVIGANSDDGTIIVIGGVEIGRTEEFKGTSNRDFVFYVEVDGFYTLRARSMERGGGAALELHEVLADGTRILLNDVANGGSAVFAPAQ